MKVLLLLLITGVWGLVCPAAAAQLHFSNFAGLTLSVGKGSGFGQFGLGATAGDVSFADRSVITLDGDIRTVSLKYRLALPETPFYFGMNGTFYQGSLSGVREWSTDGATVALSFESKTLYTLGVEVGYSPLSLPRFYFYLGGGVAAGNLTIRGSAHYQTDSWTESTTGWAVGTVASGGLEYALTRYSHISLDLSQVSFAGDLAGGRGITFDASADQQLMTIAYVLRF